MEGGSRSFWPLRRGFRVAGIFSGSEGVRRVGSRNCIGEGGRGFKGDRMGEDDRGGGGGCYGSRDFIITALDSVWVPI